MSDPIHNPAHYTAYPVQPIEITRYLGFCLGNVVKYALRAPYKGGAEDINKALKYLEWEEERPQALLTHAAYLAAFEKLEQLSDFLHGRPSTPWEEIVTEAQADFLDTLVEYLEHGSRRYIGESLRPWLVRLAEAIDVDHCRVCGCTDDHACEGGCSWVEEDLCSACVGQEGQL